MTAQGAWTSFWQAGGHQAAYSAGGSPEAVLRAHWTNTFAQLTLRPNERVLDIAAGAGVVSKAAMDCLPGSEHLRFHGLDIAHSGAIAYGTACPRGRAVVADAAALPFADESMALVVSQFGIEYASESAAAEAARVLKPDGYLRLALHYREGGLFLECAANRDAISALTQSNLLTITRQLFETHAGPGPDGKSRMQLLVAFNSASRVVADHLARAGSQVAGGTLLRLLQDCSHMVGRAQTFEPQEVLAWLDRTEAETALFARRMHLMCDAALDRPAADRLVEELKSQGMRLEPLQALTMGTHNPLPGAWIVQGVKGPPQNNP
ncbi:MAG: class I SAM-dependent methyltransferase [Betaproteobacteria bacterium]|nr:class I SAM-dependent methyltransferase [Betaproteobacteria bacterium]